MRQPLSRSPHAPTQEGPILGVFVVVIAIIVIEIPYDICCCRWVNILDPSLNRGAWTQEEDLKLKAAIREHGYCWSRIAACLNSRTDNQCRRYEPSIVPVLSLVGALEVLLVFVIYCLQSVSF